MTLNRHITGTQVFADQPLAADVHKIRSVYIQELREKAQDIVDDLDTHIGNYGLDHHKAADDNNAGFMTPEQKKLLEEHTHDHTGPDGAAHGLASYTRNGFQSAEDKKLWDGHRGYGGTAEHPLVTSTTAGFMSSDQASKLQTIWDTYVTKSYFDANMFRIYYVTRTSPSMALGYDGGTGWFTFRVPRTSLETAAGRALMPFTAIFSPTYTVHSYLYNWSSPYSIVGVRAYNDGTDIVMGVALSGAGTYHRSGALKYTMSVPLIPTNSVVSV